MTPAANLLLVSLIPVAILPPVSLTPVSTTLTKLVAKFAAGVIDSDGNFATDVNDTSVLDTSGALWLANIPRIFEKIWNGPYGILGGWGKLIHEKTRSKKVVTLSL
jgi:hypothetical protein